MWQKPQLPLAPDRPDSPQRYETKKRGDYLPAFGFEKPYSVVTQEGLEPPTTSSEDWCSIQLSYWAVFLMRPAQPLL